MLRSELHDQREMIRQGMEKLRKVLLTSFAFFLRNLSGQHSIYLDMLLPFLYYFCLQALVNILFYFLKKVFRFTLYHFNEGNFQINKLTRI